MPWHVSIIVYDFVYEITSYFSLCPSDCGMYYFVFDWSLCCYDTSWWAHMLHIPCKGVNQMLYAFAGSFNFNVCSSGEVPIYLLVAGMLMIAELLFHGVLWLLMKYSDSDSTYRALRMCDCVAFSLLIWLLIGSNWVFKLSVARYRTTAACNTYPIDDIIRLNSTVVTDGSGIGATQWIIVSDSAPDSTHPSSTSCMDCSSGVYQFTVIVILLQYIAALVVIVGCCSKMFKKWS